MPQFNIDLKLTTPNKLRTKLVGFFRRILTGVTSDDVLHNTLIDARETLAKHISGQIGRPLTDVKNCITIQRTSLVVVDEPRTLASDIVSTTGRGLITRQGKRQIRWRSARVVSFGSGVGMIAYYAKGHRPKQRNPRQFGDRNAYLKYAVTVDQAATAIIDENAPEHFIQSIQSDYEKRLNRVFQNG
jgi:hypothetical protein